MMTYLLGIDPDDPDAYSEPVRKLILAMTREGAAPLAKLLDEKAGAPVSEKLLAGLNPETVRRAACAWAANMEYEAPAQAQTPSGWYAESLELKYKPVGHADPVINGWMEFGIMAAEKASEETKSAAVMVRETFLSRDFG